MVNWKVESGMYSWSVYSSKKSLSFSIIVRARSEKIPDLSLKQGVFLPSEIMTNIEPKQTESWIAEHY